MTTIRVRRDSSAKLTAADPVLADGELVYDKTEKFLKVGDGKKKWSLLPWLLGKSIADWKDLFNKANQVGSLSSAVSSAVVKVESLEKANSSSFTSIQNDTNWLEPGDGVYGSSPVLQYDAYPPVGNVGIPAVWSGINMYDRTQGAAYSSVIRNNLASLIGNDLSITVDPFWTSILIHDKTNKALYHNDFYTEQFINMSLTQTERDTFELIDFYNYNNMIYLYHAEGKLWLESVLGNVKLDLGVVEAYTHETYINGKRLKYKAGIVAPIGGLGAPTSLGLGGSGNIAVYKYTSTQILVYWIDTGSMIMYGPHDYTSQFPRYGQDIVTFMLGNICRPTVAEARPYYVMEKSGAVELISFYLDSNNVVTLNEQFQVARRSDPTTQALSIHKVFPISTTDGSMYYPNIVSSEYPDCNYLTYAASSYSKYTSNNKDLSGGLNQIYNPRSNTLHEYYFAGSFSQDIKFIHTCAASNLSNGYSMATPLMFMELKSGSTLPGVDHILFPHVAGKRRIVFGYTTRRYDAASYRTFVISQYMYIDDNSSYYFVAEQNGYSVMGFYSYDTALHNFSIPSLWNRYMENDIAYRIGNSVVGGQPKFNVVTAGASIEVSDGGYISPDSLLVIEPCGMSRVVHRTAMQTTDDYIIAAELREGDDADNSKRRGIFRPRTNRKPFLNMKVVPAQSFADVYIGDYIHWFRIQATERRSHEITHNRVYLAATGACTVYGYGHAGFNSCKVLDASNPSGNITVGERTSTFRVFNDNAYAITIVLSSEG